MIVLERYRRPEAEALRETSGYNAANKECDRLGEIAACDITGEMEEMADESEHAFAAAILMES